MKSGSRKGDKKELLRKLKALAERGEEHERQSAQAMLDKLIKKYGLEDEDLNTEDIVEACYTYKGKEERKLLLQTIYKIIGNINGVYRYESGKGSRSELYLKCKKSEELQIRIEFDFYRKLWEEEKDFFLECFIQKHRIFGIRDKYDEDDEELDLKTALRMELAMKSMQDKNINPAIERGQVD